LVSHGDLARGKKAPNKRINAKRDPERHSAEELADEAQRTLSKQGF